MPARRATLWLLLLVAALSPGVVSAQSFVLEIQAPPAERALLAENLSLPRYQGVSDLDEAEFTRLLELAERETRAFLATLGEFAPHITLTRDAQARPPRITLRVTPGPVTRVSAVDLAFEGDIASSADPAVQAQREALRHQWLLPPGERFTQAGWDAAKAGALRTLQARRYPRARQVDSLAEIDAPTARARLGLVLDSGPRMRLGPLQASGLHHHTPLAVRRFARLQEGADYDAQALQDAQDRLVASGYFDSAFLHVDPESDPSAAPVQATLREAPLQTVVLGLGLSTDQGARASLEHRHLHMPGIGGRLDTRIELQSRTPSLQSEWQDIPDARGWRPGVLVRAERQRDGALRTDGLRLRAGRLLTGERIDRHAYLQFDQARVRGDSLAATGPHDEGRAVTANYAWTTRRFDQLPDARRGFGLGLEMGLGLTLLGQSQPFQRSYVRGLWLHPLEGSNSRLQLRAEAGAVLASTAARVPATALFRTGGDSSVRGYTLREIGVRQSDGSTAAGHYLAVGSVEWLRPIRPAGGPSAWEQAFFVDSGAVADRAGRLQFSTGLGTGFRFASPVGPLRADLAWGVQPRRLRLHLNVGVVF